MRVWTMIYRGKIGRTLLWAGVPLLLLPITSLAQNTVIQTLNADIVPLGGLFTLNSRLALTKTDTTFRSFMGAMTLSYRARTGEFTGQGSITVKATSDFSPSGGPSIASPPNSSDKLTYTCSGATLGVSCGGVQTLSTTAATTVVSMGASACTGGGSPCSTANPNTANITLILPDDPKYKTGSYSATLTFTISAS